MSESFAYMLAEGGKTNSLGRAEEVLQIVLADKSRLGELFDCLHEDDAWLRMRAIDTIEKVCRVHPDWLAPYIDRLLHDIAEMDQASIKWHLAQMYGEMKLTPAELEQAIAVMKRNIADVSADWIVASNTMETLTKFVEDGRMLAEELIPLLQVQQKHHSNAVVKRANKYLESIVK